MSIIENATRTRATNNAATSRRTATGKATGAKNNIDTAPVEAWKGGNLSRTAIDKRVAVTVPDWTLYVPIDMWTLIMYIQQEVRIEFGFDGVVSVVNGEKRAFRLEKLVIPKQIVTAGSVDYLDSAGNLVSIEDQPNLILHGHSHGDSDVFWSSIDESDIEDWLGTHYLNIVINNNNQVLGRIDFFVEVPGSGIHEHVGAANLRLVLEFPEKYKNEYAKMVSNIVIDHRNAAANSTRRGAPPTGMQGKNAPLNNDDRLGFLGYCNSACTDYDYGGSEYIGSNGKYSFGYNTDT